MIVIHLRPRTRQPLRVAVDAVAFPVASWHGLLAHVIRKMDRVPEANSKLLYALDVTVHDSPATADWTHPKISHFPPVHKCNMLYERGIWYAISLMGIKKILCFKYQCSSKMIFTKHVKWIHRINEPTINGELSLVLQIYLSILNNFLVIIFTYITCMYS